MIIRGEVKQFLDNLGAAAAQTGSDVALHVIGMQGWEYLDLGRVWQVLLTLGLFFWAFMLFRGLRGALRHTSRLNMPWLFFFTGLAIPAFYFELAAASPA